MTDAFTDNCGLVLQVTGSNVGTWGSDLNTNDITITDSVLGKTLSVSLASSNVNLTQAQRQNLAFKLTGTISANITITFPLNFNSATVATGGVFIFDNQTTGAFTVTVKTVAAGSTGVAIYQGLRAVLYSDGTNIYWSNDGGKGIGGSLPTYDGSPDGVVTCNPGSATEPADEIWDRTNKILYVCSSAPNTWIRAVPTPAAASVPVTLGGYLTLSSSTNSIIITNDSVAATTVYYTPYIGGLISIPNGSTFSAYSFSQLSLALSSSYQAANNIYDVFVFDSSGSATIGIGPSWAASGGSITAGSCARGTGANSTAIERLGGVWTNSVSMTVNNGATTYTVGVKCGTYVGSVFIDSTAGQVTCHLTYGQSRKWGVWNAYNRVPIYLKGGDPTNDWTYATAVVRPANNDANNKVTVFSGLAEERYQISLVQLTQPVPVISSVYATVGIGYNTIADFTGQLAYHQVSGANSTDSVMSVANYVAPPALGVQVATALELCGSSTTTNFYGQEDLMLLQANWRG